MNTRPLFRELICLFILLALTTPCTSQEIESPDCEWDPYLQPSALTLFAANQPLALSSDETRCSQAESVRQEAIATYRRGEFEESLKQVEAYRHLLSAMESNDALRAEEIRARLLLCQLELLLGHYAKVAQDLPDDLQGNKDTLRHQLAIAGFLRCEALFQQGYYSQALTQLGEVRDRLTEGIVPGEATDVDATTLLIEQQLSLRLAIMAASYGQLQYAAACRDSISEFFDAARIEPRTSDRLSETATAIVEFSLQELTGKIDCWSLRSDAALVSIEQAIVLREKLGLHNDRRLIQLMLEAARVQMDVDAGSDPSYDTSLKLLTRIEKSLRELDLNHPIESARLSSLRAEVALRRENYKEAEGLLKHSNSLLVEVNPNHPVAVINKLNQLAVPSEMSRQDRARLMAIEVAKLAENCVTDGAHYSLECGRIFVAAGDAKGAEEMYAYAIKLLGPTCGPASHSLAASVDELTDLYLSTGDNARATGFMEVYLAKLGTAPDVVHKPAHIAEMRAHFEQKLERVRSATLEPNSP